MTRPAAPPPSEPEIVAPPKVVERPVAPVVAGGASFRCANDADCDGIHDMADVCPNVAGPERVGDERRGCPDDADNDGIPDGEDACPKQKGQRDRSPRYNGCPRFVQVTANEIVLGGQVEFRSSGSEIDPSSNGLLNELKNAIQSHPELTLVEIQGHTDSVGDPAFNTSLSQRRADAVKKWLIDAGIAASRLSAKGYGQSVPLADNATAEGRQKNRRVQFLIREHR